MTPSDHRPESFVETEEYVRQLVQRCTDKAIAKSRRRRLIPRRHAIAAAAAIAVVAGLTLVWEMRGTAGDPQEMILPPTAAAGETVADAGPVANYLAQISDEEAMQIVIYEVEEVPEY